LNFIAIVDGPWTIGNELMTPTLKIKRASVEGRYQPLVDQWEKLNRPVVWESAP
jgi:long-chain acyl-CoA synthetase